MEFGSVEYQLAIWNLFNLGRIGSAMATIGTILAIIGSGLIFIY